MLCWAALIALSSQVQAQVPSTPAPHDNLVSFERMGAGVPAAWRLRGENFEWVAESEPGPLGSGAARIRFTGKGSITLESPARFMRRDVVHAVRLWVRSEPAGARVKMAIRDNGYFPTGSRGDIVSGESVAQDKWQLAAVQGKLSETKGDHYYLELRVAGEDCTVWLDGLYVGEWDGAMDEASLPKPHPAGVALEPVAAWGLVTGAEAMQARATVVGVTQPGCKLALRAVHTSGVTEDLAPIEIDAAGIWRGVVEVTGKAGALFGMTRIEAMVIGPDGKPLSAMGETLLARAPEPLAGPLEDSAFGVHVGLREPEIAVAAKLGYKWCRIHDASGSTKWGLLEPEPGKWVWQDDAIALAGKHGMKILGLLDTSPPWASGVSSDGYWSIYGVPKNIEDWRNYVRTVVGRYAGVIDRWEVWNEPWNNAGNFTFFQNGSPPIYVELLKAAYEEAKKTNPNATIVGVDTYPMWWDQAVLAAGAYPYYDVLSFHRYDHSLEAMPNDAISFEADRIRGEQAKYGAPKPLEMTEGGPDVALYHGSFFSFADARITGDWQRGSDQYARMFLGVIASGVQRFTAYSIHGVPRHGDPTHMMVEPGPLLRPLHLTVSALAQFVEGAAYEGRLAPQDAISAHVFVQPNARFFSNEPSMVVALIANGNERETLPRPLSDGLHCFDRWGNPTETPKEATRGITYLVAAGIQAQAALREALQPAPEAAEYPEGVEGLLMTTLASLTQGAPPLWALFTSQGSLATLGGGEQGVTATRAMLKNDPALAKQFVMAGAAPKGAPVVQQAGVSVGGWVELAAGEREWAVTFSAAPDGAKGRWRLVTLTIVPNANALTEEQMQPAGELLEQWERGVGTGDILSLRDTLMPKPFCVLFAMPNGEVLAETSYFTTMLHAMVVYNMKKSAMTITRMAGAGNVVTALGLWEVDSPFTGPMKLAITATLVRDGDAWKLMTLSCGPQLPQPAPQEKPAEKPPEVEKPAAKTPAPEQAQEQRSPSSAPTSAAPVPAVAQSGAASRVASPAHAGITLVAIAVGGIMVLVLLVIGLRRMRRR